MAKLDRAWMRQQLDDPQAAYTITELMALSGLPRKRLMRYLLKRRLIHHEQSREQHEITLDRILQLIPEFWRSVRLRVAGQTERRT